MLFIIYSSCASQLYIFTHLSCHLSYSSISQANYLDLIYIGWLVSTLVSHTSDWFSYSTLCYFEILSEQINMKLFRNNAMRSKLIIWTKINNRQLLTVGLDRLCLLTYSLILIIVDMATFHKLYVFWNIWFQLPV